MFNIVKRYFDCGIYSKAAVERFVLSGVLTEDEFHKIVDRESDK